MYFKHGFDWNAVNYAPIVTIAVMLAVTIWYLVSAKNTFKGPVKTIQFADDGVTVAIPTPSRSDKPMRLAGKVCVITGAAGGIGGATATVFEREGARVVGVDLRPHASASSR